MKISYVLLFLVVVFLVAFVILFHRSLENDVNVYDYYSGGQRENVESSQIIPLWDEDNIPTETIYTENTGNYFDDPGFVPYMTHYEAEGDAKGLY